MENKPITLSKTDEIVIGKNKYIVTTTFSETARETTEQKYLRYVTERVTAIVKDDKSAITALVL